MNDFTSIYNGQQVEKAVGASFVPTLNAAPTSSTVSYTRDGNSVNFEIGQFARVAKQGGGYDMYQLYDLSTAGEPAVTVASWEKVGDAVVAAQDRVVTVDFRTFADTSTLINMDGAITITDIAVVNVTTLYLSYGNVVKQTVTPGTVNIPVAAGDTIIVGIVRTAEEQDAAVALKWSFAVGN